MILSHPDEKVFLEWSLWLSCASKSLFRMQESMDRLISKTISAWVVLGDYLRTGGSTAVTLLRESLAPPSERKYFEREVKIMHTLLHPYMVLCYDVFDTHLRTPIVMEYLEGDTIGDMMTNHKDLSPEV